MPEPISEVFLGLALIASVASVSFSDLDGLTISS
jgi:hypothetical protein